ncbi:WRKY transcription factor WRKY24-like [Setaria italica]|uniref:WRKY transcription factor WRKY24-like n=1 Tax=Setaria italica TaxID=4555 RepID=UPI000BE4EE55|nr:WRKY transcription factor WRKY24-like [Setaria italica]
MARDGVVAFSLYRSTCDEGHDQGQGRHRGKGAAAVSEGLAASGQNDVAAALGVGAVRMKKAGDGGGKARRKVREPRLCFKTMSDINVLDDSYKWRKYDQKVVKNTQHPRFPNWNLRFWLGQRETPNLMRCK